MVLVYFTGLALLIVVGFLFGPFAGAATGGTLGTAAFAAGLSWRASSP